MVEWTQSSEDNPRRPVDHQLSYETEWDMINAVSFRRKAHTHGDGKTMKSNVAEILLKKKPLLYQIAFTVHFTQYLTENVSKLTPASASEFCRWSFFSKTRRWKSVTVTKRITYCHIVTGGSSHANDRNKWAFSFNVCDLRSITVKCEGWSYIIFRLKDGTALPAIHFHQGGSTAFLDSLRKSVQINE